MTEKQISFDDWVEGWIDKFDELEEDCDRLFAVKELIIGAASQAINEYRELYKHSLN